MVRLSLPAIVYLDVSQNSDLAIMTTTNEVMEPFAKLASKTPLLIAPEQSDKLIKEVFKGKKWPFELVSGASQFYADPQNETVSVSSAGLAAMWALSHVVFNVMEMAADAHKSAKGNAERTYSVDLGREWRDRDLGSYLGFAERLLKKDELWPADLNRPDAASPPNSREGRINNAFLGAVSWVLLHEIGHVSLKHERFIPADGQIDQERAADDFATRWIFAKAGSGRRREFRILMVSIGLCYLFLVERVKGPSTVHPFAYRRFEAASQCFGGGKRSAGLFYAYVVFKCLFDPTGASPAAGFASEKQAFRWMQLRLREIFPIA